MEPGMTDGLAHWQPDTSIPLRDGTLGDGLRFERDNSPGRGPDMEERLKRFGG